MDIEIGKWGNSLGLRIPAVLAKSLGLVAGSSVRLQALNDKLIIEKTEPAGYVLENLLDDINEDNLHGPVETGPAVGRETW